MQEQLGSSLTTEGLVKKTDRILVAVSGGADSIVMLRLLHHLDYHVEAAHCNFQLRGPESEKDASFVEELCTTLGITLHMRNFDTRNYANENNLGIQEAARNLRYNWFYELKKKGRLDWIATGHSLTDHLETVLINQIRGTGISGLEGIQTNPESGLLRPLLSFSASEIRSYANELGWKYREDSSNASDSYLRNQIRHHVLPELLRIEPKVERIVLNNSKRIADQRDMLDHLLDNAQQAIVEEDADSVKIPISKVLTYPHPYLLLYNILSKYGFDYNLCLQLSTITQTGKQLFSNSHTATVDRGYWHISPTSNKPKSIEVKGSGLYRFGGWELDVQEDKLGTSTLRLPKNQCIFQKTSDSFTIRSWEEGDRINPLGMNGSKLVSDVFVDGKVGLHEKHEWPLISQGSNLIWIAHLCFSELFKINVGRPNDVVWRISARRAE
ncbi:MAG: tRNA lysidine(34) synthetase TilS [Bacteroidia bacterium]|nr:tRNA lysidine(34) synthetase TilS [Bacteroidia bacterium]